jgi:hypothetical protein
MKNKAKNKYLPFCALLLALMLLVPFLCFGGRRTPQAETAGSAAETTVTALTLSAADVTITARFPAYTGANRKYLVRFKANEYHGSADFIHLYDGIGDDNKADGYDTDRAYYSVNTTGLFEGELTGNALTVARYSEVAGEIGYDKIFDKFYVLDNATVQDGRVSGGTVVDGPKFVTSITAARTFAASAPSSIKGLEAVNYDDAEKLGIKHASVGLDINALLTSKGAADAIPFDSNGKTWYFSQNNLRENDRQIIGMTNAGFTVTQLLLIWGSRVGVNSILAHPNYEKLENFSLNICAANVTTTESVAAYTAVYEFLADRYTRPDKRFGRVENWVIGNEVESACQWNNMGYIPIDEYIRQYERAVRLAYNAIKKTWSAANVLICTSHFWGVDVATQYMNYDREAYEPFLGKGSFTTKAILTEFAREAKAGGDYLWQLAYHPYRANAIGESVLWNDVNHEASRHDEDAPKVTTLNIDVLTNYLAKSELQYEGRTRDYYVTEYGVGTPMRDGLAYDPDFITDEDLNNQAASYIYTYYMLYFSGARAFIFHRQFDVSYESGENVGLWTRQKNTSQDLYKKKPIWEVVKYIDTKYSLQVTTPYLQFIKMYPSDESPASWADIIPGFDIKKLENSPLASENKLSTVDVYDNSALNLDFENSETGGLSVCDAATRLDILKDSEVAYNGEYGLLVQYESTGSTGGGLAEKGIVRYYEAPIDLTGYGALNFAVRLDQNKPELNHTVTVRFYAGTHITEFRAPLDNGVYSLFSAAVDKDAWAYFDRVEKIKIWVSADDLAAPGGLLCFDDIGFSLPPKGGGTDGVQIALICVMCVLFAGACALAAVSIVKLRKKKKE